MTTLVGKLIRIACNEESADDALDLETGLAPVLWRGASARIQCSMFAGDPSATTFVDSIAGITSVELIVRVVDNDGAVILDKVVLAANISASSYAAWAAGTGQQFEFSLLPNDTSWDTLSDGRLNLYFSIIANTATAPLVIAHGKMLLQDVGILNVAPSDLPNNYIEFSVNSAGTYNVVPLRNQAVVKVTAQVGTVPYTFKLVLTVDGVLPGAWVDMLIVTDAGTNQTVEVHNATSSGTLLHTSLGDSDNARSDHITFRLNTSLVWEKFGPEIS